MKGFKQFLLRGNVVDLAVGVVIGAAFGAVVTAFVKDLLTPFIAALVGKPSLEKRRQIERLLEQFDRAVPPPEPLRRLRAIEVLERIGTADAERVLQTLAEGVVEDPLVGEAKASLSRLARRRP